MIEIDKKPSPLIISQQLASLRTPLPGRGKRMKIGHIVIWYIDKRGLGSDEAEQRQDDWSVETLPEGIARDLKYYNCSRIHSVNGYGCAFLEGNLSDIIRDLSKYPPCLKFRVRPSTDSQEVGIIFEKIKEGVQLPDMDAVLETSLNISRP